MNQSVNSEEIIEEASDLVNQFKTVQLATLNPAGNPEASYAPYIKQAGRYYIFISELASHTANILRHPMLSLFFIQNEVDAKNLFARRRLTIECSATPIPREHQQWETLLDLFQAEHGPTVELLRSLPDFQLFELTPSTANYVKGFGQAFTLEGENLQTVKQSKGK
ncbi:HugZ family protein [Alkalimarinus coralli]|uniref:HugZ family pyridoxamine 5'-phosphate oxidase n=1 Tax=Alkalimarinus coralli TaxID=2935863 RepID=UPI00202AD887|nr:pyridoxamine 5'-phosphate oxidase family protein [Alkalimarinus coralli]